MLRIWMAALLVLLLTAGAALAQDAEQTRQKTREMTKEKREQAGDLDIERMRGILDLPEEAQEARKAGIPAEEVRRAMDEARKRGLSMAETGEILRESGRAARENGRVDNFGAFVGEQLDQGKRGRDLAEAIHAEHRNRGMGKGSGGHDGKGRKQEQNKNQHENRNKDENKEQGNGGGGKKGGKSHG